MIHLRRQPLLVFLAFVLLAFPALAGRRALRPVVVNLPPASEIPGEEELYVPPIAGHDGGELQPLPGHVFVRLKVLPPALEAGLAGAAAGAPFTPPPARFGSADLDALAGDLGVTAIRRLVQSAGGPGFVGSAAAALLVVHYRNDVDPVEAARRFATLGGVIYAEPERETLPLHLPNDPLVPSQGVLTHLRLFEAWDLSRGGGVVACIIDTGLQITHPDLAPNLWANLGEDTNGDTVLDVLDVNGIDDDANTWVDDFHGINVADGAHGTAVAGCLSAATNNATGVAGNAYRTKLMYGSGSPYFGIAYAIDKGAQVVNISLIAAGGGVMRDLVATANAQGVVVLVGGANWNANLPNELTEIDGVLGVAAVEGCSPDPKAWFSAFGDTNIDLAAPGNRCIRTTAEPSTYSNIAGTSAASPEAAGIVALVRSQHPTWTADQVIAHVKGTAVNVDWNEANRKWYSLLGTGRIDAARALAPDDPTPGNGIGENADPSDDYESLPSLHVERLALVDDPALSPVNDGDGAAEPGELVAVVAHLVNRYGGTVDDVDAVLTTLSPTVAIVDGTSTFARFGARSSGDVRRNNGASPFLVLVAATATAPHSVVKFRLQLTERLSAVLLADLMANSRLVSAGESEAGVLPLAIPDASKSVRLGRTPRFTDLDGDNVRDVLVAEHDATRDGSIHPLRLQAWSSTGAPLPGFPLIIEGNVQGELAVGTLLAAAGGGRFIAFSEAESPAVQALRANGLRLFRTELAPTQSRFSSPALGDVDGDGEAEVVALLSGDVSSGTHEDPAIYSFERGGLPTPGFPVLLGRSAEARLPVALADLNGDTLPDVVAASGDEIHVVDGTGSPLPGWPVVLPAAADAAPVAGDVDGDGRLDVIVATRHDLLAFDDQGNLLAGFPLRLDATSNAATQVSQLALGDVEGDGRAEIAVAVRRWVGVTPVRWRNEAFVVEFDPAAGGARVRSGFPVLLATAAYSTAQYYPTDLRDASPASFSDLDGDDRLEVLFGERRELHVLRADGTSFGAGTPLASPIPLIPQLAQSEVVHGFCATYRPADDRFLAPPAVVDVDDDGLAEIAFASRSRLVNVLRTNAPMGRTPWTTVRGDEGNTGTLAPTTDLPAPRILSVTPALASNCFDHELTVTGSNFFEVVSAWLGLTTVPCRFVDSSRVIVTVPSGFAPGVHAMRLGFDDGRGRLATASRLAAYESLACFDPPTVEPEAWVACPGDDHARWFDLSTMVVGSVPVGSRPSRVVLSPDRRHAWVLNAGSSNVSVIDTATRLEVDTMPGAAVRFPVGPDAVGLDVGAVRGRGLLVAVSSLTGGLQVIDALSAVTDPATAPVTATAAVADTLDVALDVGGRGLAYVSSWSANAIFAYDLTGFPTLTLARTFLLPAGFAGGRLGPTPDGRYLLATDATTGAIHRIDLDSGAHVNLLTGWVFFDPMSADFTFYTATGRAFLTSGFDSRMVELQVDPLAILVNRFLPVGEGAGGDERQPESRIHLITAQSANRVFVYDMTSPGTPTGMVPIPGRPVDLALQNTAATPVALSLTPDHRSEDCPIDAVLRGRYLAPGCRVFIGGLECQVTFVSHTWLDLVIPAGLALGSHDLFLFNPDGQWASLPAAFTVTSAADAPEVRVNTPMVGPQVYVDVARGVDGSTIVTWQTATTGSGPYTVMAKVYGPTGAVALAEFAVSPAPSLASTAPSVAVDALGRFSVAWLQGEYDNLGRYVNDVHLRRYSRTGGLDLDLKVNQNPFYSDPLDIRSQLYCASPDVAADADGNVVVVWQRHHGGGFQPGVMGRRLGADGSSQPSGQHCPACYLDEFGTQPYLGGIDPHVAASRGTHGDGAFVFTFTSLGGWPYNERIRAQRFAMVDGVTLEPVLFVNDNPAALYRRSAGCGMSDDGRFAVSWMERPDLPGNNDWNLGMKLYDEDAVAVTPAPGASVTGFGDEYRPSEFLTGAQAYPDVAMDTSGWFVVAWSSPQDGFGDGIFAKRYSREGVELEPPCGTRGLGVGNEMQLNAVSVGAQVQASISVQPAGGMAAGWYGSQLDPAWGDAFLRRFARDARPE